MSYKGLGTSEVAGVGLALGLKLGAKLGAGEAKSSVALATLGNNRQAKEIETTCSNLLDFGLSTLKA